MQLMNVKENYSPKKGVIPIEESSTGYFGNNLGTRYTKSAIYPDKIVL